MVASCPAILARHSKSQFFERATSKSHTAAFFKVPDPRCNAAVATLHSTWRRTCYSIHGGATRNVASTARRYPIGKKEKVDLNGEQITSRPFVRRSSSAQISRLRPATFHRAP